MERSRSRNVGWALLMGVSGLLLLNGIGWFFLGPSLSTFEQDTGIALEEFTNAYPTVAKSIAVNARQVAIWFMAFGLLSLFTAREGLVHGSKRAWNGTWLLVAAPAAVGLNVLIGGESIFGLGMLGVGGIALVAQFMARPNA